MSDKLKLIKDRTDLWPKNQQIFLVRLVQTLLMLEVNSSCAACLTFSWGEAIVSKSPCVNVCILYIYMDTCVYNGVYEVFFCVSLTHISVSYNRFNGWKSFEDREGDEMLLFTVRWIVIVHFELPIWDSYYTYAITHVENMPYSLTKWLKWRENMHTYWQKEILKRKRQNWFMTLWYFQYDRRIFFFLCHTSNTVRMPWLMGTFTCPDLFRMTLIQK